MVTGSDKEGTMVTKDWRKKTTPILKNEESGQHGDNDGERGKHGD